jgi:hypothetical protein
MLPLNQNWGAVIESNFSKHALQCSRSIQLASSYQFVLDEYVGLRKFLGLVFFYRNTREHTFCMEAEDHAKYISLKNGCLFRSDMISFKFKSEYLALLKNVIKSTARTFVLLLHISLKVLAALGRETAIIDWG